MRKSTYTKSTVVKPLLYVGSLVLVLWSSPSRQAPLASDAIAAAKAEAQADESCIGLCGVEPVSQTSMGRFFENEIANRVERVSGKQWTKTSRIRFARELSSAIAQASYDFDIDPFLLMAMVEVESRYNTAAVGLHGEQGLMQIKPSTAKWIVPIADQSWGCDLHTVRCNITTGARYLSHLQAHARKRGLEFESAHDSRIYLLRSYNLGPARAFKIATTAEVELDGDREPAAEVVEAAAVQPPAYADKISNRAIHMRSRYLQAATMKQVVTTVALAQ